MLSALYLQGRQRVHKWRVLWNSHPKVREANKQRDKTFLTGLSSILQNGEEKNSEAVNASGNLKPELNQLVSPILAYSLWIVKLWWDY